MDLTYAQFNDKKKKVNFQNLLQNGYQQVNDLEFNAYLRNIEDNDLFILLEEAFYSIDTKRGR